MPSLTEPAVRVPVHDSAGYVKGAATMQAEGGTWGTRFQGVTD